MKKYIVRAIDILDDRAKYPEQKTAENGGQNIIVNVISYEDYKQQGGKDKEGELYLDGTIAKKYGITGKNDKD